MTTDATIHGLQPAYACGCRASNDGVSDWKEGFVGVHYRRDLCPRGRHARFVCGDDMYIVVHDEQLISELASGEIGRAESLMGVLHGANSQEEDECFDDEGNFIVNNEHGYRSVDEMSRRHVGNLLIDELNVMSRVRGYVHEHADLVSMKVVLVPA